MKLACLRAAFCSALALAATFATAAQLPEQLTRWLVPQRWEKDTDGPIVELGQPGEFDDMHLFAPAVIEEQGRYWMWYPGSQGTRGSRVFRLGLATSADGKQFTKHEKNPVLEFADGQRSVLTPALLRDGQGHVLREQGQLRMWFAAADLRKGGLHTLHESTSRDGLQWTAPGPVLAENVYCPSVLKTGDDYEMWFSDVSRRPWVIRHATSRDGRKWEVNPLPAIVLSQPWEAEVLVYPTVLKIDGAYLMWYGSYDHAVRRQTTAIGFAVSDDGLHWHKHPDNPVIRPDAMRPWESNYVGSGCVMRLADGSFRYWYASRKAPPFENLYFAINTARWTGPGTGAPPVKADTQAANAERPSTSGLLPLPLKNGEAGRLPTAPAGASGRAVDVLEIIDQHNAIIRIWYLAQAVRDAPPQETFVDAWLRGFDTAKFAEGSPVELSGPVRVSGNQSFGTTCGGRRFPLLEPSN